MQVLRLKLPGTEALFLWKVTTGTNQHDQCGDDHDYEGSARNNDHDYKLKENLQDVQRGGRQPTQLDHTPGFYIQFIQSLALGKDPATKSDEFLEKFKGGGTFSIQNFMLQILGTLNRAF